MSPIDTGSSNPNTLESLAPASGTLALRLFFTAALFLSASLLFAVQPLFTKMVLPVLGGSPAVWSVAMVFFQGLLLAGYLYAHFLSRLLSVRNAAAIHLCLFAIAWITLPITASAASSGPPAAGQAIWLLTVFAAALGLPFFALSANGPLLQAWFARSNDPRAHDPYFLYGASNIGSFFALLSYPLIFEPLLGLKSQSMIWSAGFLILGIGIGICALLTLRASPALSVRKNINVEAANEPAKANFELRRFATWVFLGLVPSGLLVSVTAHISTDIAAAPLLWVMPLALFLLTFVITFRDRALPLEGHLGQIQIWLTAFVFFTMSVNVLPLVANLALHLMIFFVIAIICHRTLYNLRPASNDLTLFYVAMSLGGVLGGLFAALGGPVLFSSVVEYPLLITAALFCNRSFLRLLTKVKWDAYLVPLLLPFTVAVLTLFGANPGPQVIAAVFVICMIVWWRRPERVAIFAVSSFLLLALQPLMGKTEFHRSFFGVHKLVELKNGTYRAFIHGTTLHGVMRIRNADGTPCKGRPQPASYYAFAGPIGEAITSVRSRRGSLNHIYAIGQGVGTLACHRREGEKITFFEIDPLVAKIAGDSSKFRFMSDCAPNSRVIIGDARLTVAKEKQKAEVIVVDAFSSDAIPVHLLTREAFGIYLNKLNPDGVIVIHITNRTMDLSQIIARVAAEHKLLVYRRFDLVRTQVDDDMRATSIAVALARNPEHLGKIATSKQWKKLTPNRSDSVWTDDYSTILTAIAAKLRSNLR